MKNLFLAILLAFAFTAQASDTTLTSNVTLETNCVVTVFEERDSAVNLNYIISVGVDTIYFETITENFTIILKDVISDIDYYGGYERVVDYNTNIDGQTLTVLYHDGELITVGINLVDGTSTFYLHNTDMP